MIRRNYRISKEKKDEIESICKKENISISKFLMRFFIEDESKLVVRKKRFEKDMKIELLDQIILETKEMINASLNLEREYYYQTKELLPEQSGSFNLFGEELSKILENINEVNDELIQIYHKHKCQD